uniref:MYND-type domain-containing protein n=2 Tax=Anopheles arabiensis TaxID=7173 RepID=A0A182I768_ANOAR
MFTFPRNAPVHGRGDSLRLHFGASLASFHHTVPFQTHLHLIPHPCAMASEYPNFHPNKCNVCFLESPMAKPSVPAAGPLLLCKKCKLIKYCSKKHQTYDAPSHKEFCTAVQSVLQKSGTDHVLRCTESFLGKLFNSNPENLTAFMNHVHCTGLLISKILQRPLYHHENQMLSFPALCNVCLEYRPERLFFCDNCQQVAYCSEEHQQSDREAHAKWCDGLRLNFYYGTDTTNCATKLYPNFDFEQDETSQKPFPKDTFELLSAAAGRDIQTSLTEPGLELAQELENINAAGIFSPVGTILHVLRTVGLQHELEEELNVFVLGAELDYLCFNPVTEAVLFRFLPKLRRLRLYLIGPNVNDAASSVMHFMNNRTIEVEVYRYLFHKLPPQFKLPKPHLAVAFNCGFNEFFGTGKHTWDETIRQLLTIPNVPLAFTSYTQREAIEDAAIVDLTGQTMPATCGKLVFMRRNVTNPFHNPVPIRNPNRDDKTDVLYYENGYLSICVMQMD